MHWGDVIGVQCGVISNQDDGDVAGGDAVSSSRHYNHHLVSSDAADTMQL